MQLTTPIEPAIAVSTAINTLSNLPQSILFAILVVLVVYTSIYVPTPPGSPPPYREGARGVGLLTPSSEDYTPRSPRSGIACSWRDSS